MNGKPWTEAELTLLHHLTLQRLEWAQVSCEVGHTAKSCQKKAMQKGWLAERGTAGTQQPHPDYECTLDYWINTYHRKKRA